MKKEPLTMEVNGSTFSNPLFLKGRQEMCKGYYSPKIKADYIPFLYYLAHYLGIPMTQLVNQILGAVIDSLKDKDLEAEIKAMEAEDKKASDISEYLKKLIQSRSRKTRNKIIKIFQEVKYERDLDASWRGTGNQRPA
jgi:hypothetical protein